jgi:hypothetical protein
MKNKGLTGAGEKGSSPFLSRQQAKHLCQNCQRSKGAKANPKPPNHQRIQIISMLRGQCSYYQAQKSSLFHFTYASSFTMSPPFNLCTNTPWLYQQPQLHLLLKPPPMEEGKMHRLLSIAVVVLAFAFATQCGMFTVLLTLLCSMCRRSSLV